MTFLHRAEDSKFFLSLKRKSHNGLEKACGDTTHRVVVPERPKIEREVRRSKPKELLLVAQQFLNTGNPPGELLTTKSSALAWSQARDPSHKQETVSVE